MRGDRLVLVSEVVEHVELLHLRLLLSGSVFVYLDLRHVERGCSLHLHRVSLLESLEVERIRRLMERLRLTFLGLVQILVTCPLRGWASNVSIIATSLLLILRLYQMLLAVVVR